MKTFEEFINEIADTSAVAHAKNRSHLFKTSRDDPARVKARVHVKTTVDETNVVLTGLGELPAKHSLSLLQKIQSQAQEQMQLKTQESTELGEQQLLTEGE